MRRRREPWVECGSAIPLAADAHAPGGPETRGTEVRPSRAPHAALLALLLLGAGCGADPGLSPVPEASSSPPASAAWTAEVRGRITASSYQPQPVEGGIRTANRPQGFTTRWADSAVTVRAASRAAGPLRLPRTDWQLELRTTSWGRADSLRPLDGAAAIGRCAAGDRLDVQGECLRRVETASPGVVEWWENGASGLEQGWTIEAPPAGSGDVELAMVDLDGDFDVDLYMGNGGGPVPEPNQLWENQTSVRNANWAYMVMASLGWTLKAWMALSLPVLPRWKAKHEAERDRWLHMEFRTFRNAVIDVPAQVVRTGRRLVFRFLAWRPQLPVVFRLLDAL